MTEGPMGKHQVSSPDALPCCRPSVAGGAPQEKPRDNSFRRDPSMGQRGQYTYGINSYSEADSGAARRPRYLDLVLNLVTASPGGGLCSFIHSFILWWRRLCSLRPSAT